MTRYRVDLTTPEAVARKLNIVNPDTLGIPQVVKDPATGQYVDFWDYVSDQIRAVSDEIMQICNRSFVPYVASLDWRYRDAIYIDGSLWLKEDLLLPTAFEIGGVTVDPANYIGLPSHALPYMALAYDTTGLSGLSTALGAGYLLTGTWGYVENLTQAWTTVITSYSMTEGDTVLPVPTVGANAFETLQYLRCESEMMQVVSRNPTDNEITVLRGVNGSTAIAHSAKALQKFIVTPAIAQAATAWAAYRYQRRTDVGQTVQLPDGSVVIANGPEGVAKALVQYQRPSPPRSVRPRVRRYTW